MIKIHNAVLPSNKQYKTIINRMRNTMNSWDACYKDICHGIIYINQYTHEQWDKAEDIKRKTKAISNVCSKIGINLSKKEKKND